MTTPIRIERLKNTSILAVTLTGDITTADLPVIDQALLQHLNIASSKEHVLLDLSEVGSLPSLRDISKQNWMHHPQIGLIAAYGLPSVPQRLMLSIFKRMANIPAHMFETRRDALRAIERVQNPRSNALSAVSQTAAVQRNRLTL